MANRNRYLVTARIQPERFQIEEGAIATVSATMQYQDDELELAIAVRYSQFVVLVTANEPINDEPTFTHDLGAVLRGVTDSLSFVKAAPYHVEMVSLFHVESNNFSILHEGLPYFEPLRELNLQPHVLIVEALRNHHLRLALADFRQALSSPVDTGVFCYRAVETIASNFASSSGDRKIMWSEMRQALKVDRAWLQPLVDESAPRRHGSIAPVSSALRKDLLERSWRIVNRFAEYLHHGSSLPSSFDLLTAPVESEAPPNSMQEPT